MSSPALTTTVRKQYGYTKVGMQHLTYEWTIKNFSLLPGENEEHVQSPTFSARENDDVKWKLTLFPKGESEDDINYVSLFLNRNSEDDEATTIQVHCEIGISNSEGIKSKGSFAHRFKGSDGYGFPQLVERSRMLSWCGSDDSITILCVIDIPQRTITGPLYQSFDVQKGQMNEHLSLFFGDSRFSDVTIIVGDEKFPAHKLLLAARSAVFAAMFEHKEMEENRMNEVKIEDMEPVTVKGMLEFFYTDKVTNLQTLAYELLRASDKYELHRLRTMCEEDIYETLTNDNAAEILVFSDLYHSNKLKEYVMKFISRRLLSVTQSVSSIIE